MEDTALFGHLLGAFALISGTVLAGASFEAARRREEPRDIANLLGLARMGALLVMLGTVLVVAFGLWLVDLGDWGYGAGWVDTALVLLFLTLVLGAAGGQKPKQARRLASRLAADGQPTSPELRALLDDRVALAGNYLAGLLLLAIVAVMVYKPGA